MLSWFKKSKPSRDDKALESTSDAAAGKVASDTLREKGNAHLEREELDAAADCYREAICIDVLNVKCRVNLAYVLQELDRNSEAEVLLAEAVSIDGANADAHYMLGNIARGRKQTDAAFRHFQSAVDAKPDFELAYRDASLACAETAQPQRAKDLLLRGIQKLPRSADLHHLLGNLLQSSGDSEAAVQSHRCALALRPAYVEAHSNVAIALRALGRLEEAVGHLQAVAAFRPKDVESHLAYGTALQALGRMSLSIEVFRKAVALDPRSVYALSGLGSALAANSMSDEAVACYESAIAADETHFFPYAGLGVELNERGRPREALEKMRQALAIGPEAVEPHSSMLFLMSFVSRPDEYIAEARRYGEKVSAHARSMTHSVVHDGAPLRVGFVSGDMRNHPVAAFLEGMLANLDRAKLEVHVYSTAKKDDEVTARLRLHATAWTSIVGMHDEAAAKRIHGDGIHVLIDVAGHTGHNRLSLFAWKPAPVQVTWLGYLASTGLQSMDYVLADRISLPEQCHPHFVEKVWYMPNSLYCFTPPLDSPSVSPTPARASGEVTFGSFQRMNKISDESLTAWARILSAVPNAKLRLQCKQLADSSLRSRFTARLTHFGIPAERTTLVGPVADRSSYLAGHHEVDIVLDTFPYPGITTTCEALWMGVPTVTRVGDTLLSRQGASLLHCVGLDEWVAISTDEYVSRAVQHAADIGTLNQLRATLRDRARSSALFDAPRFARDFETAMLGMFKNRHDRQ